MHARQDPDQLLSVLRKPELSQYQKENVFQKFIDQFREKPDFFTTNNYENAFKLLSFAAEFGLVKGAIFLTHTILPNAVSLPFDPTLDVRDLLVFAAQRQEYGRAYGRALITAATHGYASIVRMILDKGGEYEGKDGAILAIVEAAKNKIVDKNPERILKDLYPSPEVTAPTQAQLNSNETSDFSLKNLIDLGVKIEDLQECKIEFIIEEDRVVLTQAKAYALSRRSGIPLPILYGDMIVRFSPNEQDIDLLRLSNEINTHFLIYIFEHLLLTRKKIAELRIDLWEISPAIEILINQMQAMGLVDKLHIHTESITYISARNYARATLTTHNTEIFELSADSKDLNEEKFDETARTLASVLQECPLLEYSIDNIQLSDTGARHLETPLETSRTLHRLTYSNAGLSDTGLTYLINPLIRYLATRPPLVYLDVSHNTFSFGGFLKLAILIARSPTLTHLELSNTQLGNEGASLVLTALQRTPETRLRYLGLEGNLIEYFCDDYCHGEPEDEIEERKNLDSFFRTNRSLTSINLSNNPFTSEMLNAMFQGLQFNQILQYLTLRQIKHLRKPLLEKNPLAHLLLNKPRNKSLIHLDLAESKVDSIVRQQAAKFTQENYEQFLKSSRHWMIVAVGMKCLANAPIICELRLLSFILSLASLNLNPDSEAKVNNAVKIFNVNDKAVARKVGDDNYAPDYFSRFSLSLFGRREIETAARTRLELVDMKDEAAAASSRSPGIATTAAAVSLAAARASADYSGGAAAAPGDATMSTRVLGKRRR